MKKLFVSLVLVLSLCISVVVLGAESPNSQQGQSSPPAVAVVVETIR
jgi:hypothetical protein